MNNVYSDEIDNRFTPESPEVRHLLDLYDEEIRFFDDSIRRLFADLEERGLLEDTLMMVLGDHREAFLEHGEFAHCRDIAYETTLPCGARWGRGGGER